MSGLVKYPVYLWQPKGVNIGISNIPNYNNSSIPLSISIREKPFYHFQYQYQYCHFSLWIHWSMISPGHTIFVLTMPAIFRKSLGVEFPRKIARLNKHSKHNSEFICQWQNLRNYTFYENMYEICTFYENRYEIFVKMPILCLFS